MPKIPGRQETNGAVNPGPYQEQLAINLFDADRLDPLIRQRILLGKVDVHIPIYIDRKRPDEVALRFISPLLEAALACDILCSEARKLNDPPPRIYILRPGREWWKQLPPDAVMIEIVEGKSYLHETIFPGQGRPRNEAPLHPKTAEWLQ